MTIQIPGEVQWLVPIVVGADWPQGDEDALRRLSDAWTDFAGAVGEATGDGTAAAQQALQCMTGETADAFAKYWEKFAAGDPQFLPELERLAAQLAESCDTTATEVEYTKLAIIAALIILAAQIAAMVASAFVTFGASTAGIPIAQAATRITVQMVFRELVKQIALNVGINVAVDGAIQLGQLATGGRDSWDLGHTGEAALSGAAAGVASAGGGLLGKHLGTTTENMAQAAGRDALIGAGEGIVGNALNDGLHGNLPSGDSVISGAVSGGIGGAHDGMSNRHEGLTRTWETGREGSDSGTWPTDPGHDYEAGSNTRGHPFRTEDGTIFGGPSEGGQAPAGPRMLPENLGANQVNPHPDEADIDETPRAPGTLNLPRP